MIGRCVWISDESESPKDWIRDFYQWSQFLFCDFGEGHTSRMLEIENFDDSKRMQMTTYANHDGFVTGSRVCTKYHLIRSWNVIFYVKNVDVGSKRDSEDASLWFTIVSLSVSSNNAFSLAFQSWIKKRVKFELVFFVLKTISCTNQ